MKIGIYIRGLNKNKNLFKMAEQAKLSKVSFVILLVYWQEKDKDKKINSTRLTEYIQAFDGVGIDPWIWGYPWCGKEEAFVQRIETVKSICKNRLRGIVLDPELGYQGHTVGRLRAQHGATTLVNGVLDAMNENMDLGITSFGCGHVHKTFPWIQFCAGFGSPQFYKTTKLDQISRGLAHWEKAGWSELYPSVPAFGQNSGQNLQRYVSNLFDCGKQLDITMPGYIVWSWQQIQQGEWETIENLAGKM